MKTIIRNPNIIFLGLILLYFVFQLYLLDQAPDIMEDEPWYANTAYNFSQANWFTNTNTGHQGGDLFILYTFILGISIKLFGCTLFVTRMVSVVAGIIALWGLYSILQKIKVSRQVLVITLLMFVFSNVTYVVFRTARPESWILALGIWSIYFLLEFHRSQQTKSIIWASVFASLAFLTHPNGIFFLITSGIYLLFYSFKERNISNMLYFSLIALAIIVIHFTVVFLNPNISLENLISDLRDRNSFTDKKYTILENVFSFFLIYTLGIKRIYILIFEIGILIIGLLYCKKEDRLKYIPLFGLIILILSFTLLSPYSARHFGEIILFSILSFAMLTITIRNSKVRLLTIAFGIISYKQFCRGHLSTI